MDNNKIAVILENYLRSELKQDTELLHQHLFILSPSDLITVPPSDPTVIRKDFKGFNFFTVKGKRNEDLEITLNNLLLLAMTSVLYSSDWVRIKDGYKFIEENDLSPFYKKCFMVIKQTVKNRFSALSEFYDNTYTDTPSIVDAKDTTMSLAFKKALK